MSINVNNLNLKCKINKFLFRVIPVNSWQAFLIDKHFAVCPQCLADTETDKEVDALLVSPEDSRKLPPLWDGIHRKLDNLDFVDFVDSVDSVDYVDSADSPDTPQPVRQTRGKNRKFPVFSRWQWAVTGAALLLLIIVLPLSLVKNDTPDPGPGVTGTTGDQVVVQSVMIGSKAAKYYVFRSDNPDKLIVWAQKKEDVKPNET